MPCFDDSVLSHFVKYGKITQLLVIWTYRTTQFWVPFMEMFYPEILQYQSTIYHMKCSQHICEVQQLSKRLSVPRSNFMAIPIPESLAECISESKSRYLSRYSNPLILVMFWAKLNIAKIEIAIIKVIYDQYLKIANLRVITM